MIATLATRADAAGLRTCVVSTDRDAFQLCSENICLMMTPRGVADVQVYTPERVEARYGVRPDQVPDFIGLKGDTSDNIPGVPGSATRPPASWSPAICAETYHQDLRVVKKGCRTIVPPIVPRSTNYDGTVADLEFYR